MAGKRKAEPSTKRAEDLSWPELLRARWGWPSKPQKKKPKKPKTWKTRLRRFALWSTVTVVVLALIGVAGFIYLYKSIDIPDANKDFLANASIVYYDGGGDDPEELGRYALQNRESISLDEMPDNIKQAVVAAEDATFYSNNGIDTKGILRAVFNNASGGSTQGASTITQQYVKILYLNQERSYQRKVKEAILSLKVQRELSKGEVLEGYLNTIYFGRGAYGIQAASAAYFEKPAKELTLREAAVLASVLNDPNDLDPADGRQARQDLKGRYDYVLDRMAATGDITAEEADKASRKLPKFPEIEAQSTYGGQKGHMLTLIKNQVLSLKKDDGTEFTEDEIDGGGLRIYTTLQPKIMTDIEKGIEEVKPTEASDTFTKPKNLHAAAATVEPGTGALRGFYAGQDYLESQLNWAVAGGRAGSTFKAYAVAAGIKDGYSLRDTFDGNSPITVGDTEFENQGDSGGASRGSISLLAATEDSVNTAFIDLTDAMDDGPDKIISMAESMGIPPEKASRKNRYGIPTTTGGLRPETGVSLGSATVSPINMATGYATIAAEGEYAPVYVIEKVENSSGDVLYQHKVTTSRAMSKDIASDVSYALQEVVDASGGTGYEAQMDDGRPTAGKTGTATNDDGTVASSWFVGYTPQLSTAVMYVRGKGNDPLDDWLPASSDGRAGYYGGNYPAKTWNAIMTRELAGEPIEEFPEPAYVDGEAPDSGHAPYTPPPAPPTRTTRPPTQTLEPSSSAPTTKPPTTTEPPTQEPTTQEPTSAPPTSSDPCGLLGCPTSEPTSQPTSEPTTQAPDPGTPSASPRQAETFARED